MKIYILSPIALSQACFLISNFQFISFHSKIFINFVITYRICDILSTFKWNTLQLVKLTVDTRPTYHKKYTYFIYVVYYTNWTYRNSKQKLFSLWNNFFFLFQMKKKQFEYEMNKIVSMYHVKSFCKY